MMRQAGSTTIAALRGRHDCYKKDTADGRNLTGIKAKVENQGQYDEYLNELKPLREELGIALKENMYPDQPTV